MKNLEKAKTIIRLETFHEKLSTKLIRKNIYKIFSNLKNGPDTTQPFFQ